MTNMAVYQLLMVPAAGQVATMRATLVVGIIVHRAVFWGFWKLVVLCPMCP